MNESNFDQRKTARGTSGRGEQRVMMSKKPARRDLFLYFPKD